MTVHPTAPRQLFPIMRGQAADSFVCAPVDPPDSAVAYQRAETHSRFLGALSLRLPPTYVLEPNAGPPRGSEAVGGLLVASWHTATDAGTARTRRGGVSAWVVPETGLPAVGASRDARQVSFAECADPGPVPRARAVVFTVVTGADSIAYLAAAWPVRGGRHLQLIASAPSVAELEPVRRALLDARTEPAANRGP